MINNLLFSVAIIPSEDRPCMYRKVESVPIPTNIGRHNNGHAHGAVGKTGIFTLHHQRIKIREKVRWKFQCFG